MLVRLQGRAIPPLGDEPQAVPRSSNRLYLDGLAGGWHHQQVAPSRPACSRPRWLAPLLLAAPSIIFIAPFFVPLAPAFSESYLFGFSNRAALALTLLLFAGVGWLSWSGRLHFQLLETPSDLPHPKTIPQPSRRALLVSVLLAIGLSAIFFLLTRGGHGVGEAVYLLDRVGLLAQGLRPYRDFEFAYGPLQLFGPWLASRLLHLSLTDGYGLFWLLSTCLGLLALWFAVRWTDLPSQGKPATFCLLALILGAEIFGSGVNYNPLRYAAPLACLLAVYKVSRRNGALLRGFDRSTILTAMLSAGLLLGLSPEVGIVFCIAVLCFLPARRRAVGELWVQFALSLATAFAVILFGAARMGVFETMKGFSAGGQNLPLLPGPHVLLFFAAFAVVLVYVTNPHHRERLFSSTALLAFYSLGMLPGALGRCDWAHVVGYELGIFLAALLLLTPNRMTRWISRTSLLMVFLLLFTPGVTSILSVIVKVQLYPALVHGEPTNFLGKRLVELTERSMRRSYTPTDVAHKLERIRAVARLPSTDPHVLFPVASQVLYAPFGYSPQRLGNVQAREIHEGHFMGGLNMLTPAQVQQKIAEMQTHPEQDLLVSPDGLEQCEPFRGSPAELRALFLLPFVPKPRHQIALLAPVCDYIEHHYRVLVAATPQTADYALWRRLPLMP